VTFEELGGAHSTQQKSGVAITRPQDEAGMHRVRQLLLSYLPYEKPR